MYQPGGNRSTVTSKVLPNASTLGIGLQGKSMVNVPKKVEGHDLAKTTKSNFEQTIQNLKSKPNQKVLEDEYINVNVGQFRVCRRKSSTWSMS